MSIYVLSIREVPSIIILFEGLSDFVFFLVYNNHKLALFEVEDKSVVIRPCLK